MTDITTENYADVNARAIDGWNARGWEWGTPLSHEDARGWEWGTPLSHEDSLEARQGEWRILLTPTKPVPPEWYPSDLSGLRVLGRACGGGQQMPSFAALGARCTVFDYTPSQL